MSNQITPSPYNPVHMMYYNYTPPARYNTKDMFDDFFVNRHAGWANKPFYLQKWQLTDNVRLQFITEGIGQLEVHVFGSRGDLYQTYTSTVVSDPAVTSPYSLKQFDISLSDYDLDNYLFVLYASGAPLMISEWQSISDIHENTLLFECYHSTNKLNGYFTAFRPMLRVEGLLGEVEPEISLTNYRDEPGDSETLYGLVTKKRKIEIGARSSGVPDWMAVKVSECILLNNMNIDGKSYSLRSDSKINVEKLNGHPLYFISTDIEPSKNRDMSVTDAALPVAINMATVNIDEQSVGIGTGVTQIQITD